MYLSLYVYDIVEVVKDIWERYRRDQLAQSLGAVGIVGLSERRFGSCPKAPSTER